MKQQLGPAAEIVLEHKKQYGMLSEKQIFHGYWDCITDVRGCLPEARKGATMNMLNSQIYIFGGFSRDTFSDLKVFDLTLSKWSEVDPSRMRYVPDARVSHSMTSYKSNLILFGGAGAYMPNLHMMPSFNDLWQFDTTSMVWK